MKAFPAKDFTIIVKIIFQKNILREMHRRIFFPIGRSPE